MMAIVIDSDGELEGGKLWTTIDDAEKRLEQHLHRLRNDGWHVEDCGAAYRLTKVGEAVRFVGIQHFYAISETVARQ